MDCGLWTVAYLSQVPFSFFLFINMYNHLHLIQIVDRSSQHVVGNSNAQTVPIRILQPQHERLRHSLLDMIIYVYLCNMNITSWHLPWQQLVSWQWCFHFWPGGARRWRLEGECLSKPCEEHIGAVFLITILPVSTNLVVLNCMTTVWLYTVWLSSFGIHSENKCRVLDQHAGG